MNVLSNPVPNASMYPDLYKTEDIIMFLILLPISADANLIGSKFLYIDPGL